MIWQHGSVHICRSQKVDLKLRKGSVVVSEFAGSGNTEAGTVYNKIDLPLTLDNAAHCAADQLFISNIDSTVSDTAAADAIP